MSPLVKANVMILITEDVNVFTLMYNSVMYHEILFLWYYLNIYLIQANLLYIEI